MGEGVTPDKLLTLQQVAEQLNVKLCTIRSWVYRQEIETVRIGGSVRVKQSYINQLIERNTTPAELALRKDEDE